MKYYNPVLSGFYPDPSVCYANGRFYLVCSSFQYFPGVPLFESENLVNWTQIGHVLTRSNQVMLDRINSSGGVFAPTIRYNDGRFYMVTTNDTTHQNFYVFTDDIYGEWSDPIYVDQGGIDPSLYFEDGHTYFMSNGQDDDGNPGVIQCEIDIQTGQKLSKSIAIWNGSGGRYLESPHLYHIGDYYYLMAAEGGTEYGHMITYARAESVWGPFQNYPKNPVLTNRNKAPNIIQGIGHGDLIQDQSGEWHILSLGFRQMHMWMPYHNLGREVYLTPVTFDANGWFRAGDGTTADFYEYPGDFVQETVFGQCYRFENTDWSKEWVYLRKPKLECYELLENALRLHGTEVTLDAVDSPTFIAMRQREFEFNLHCHVSIDQGEAGITVYMCEDEHYEVAIRKQADHYEAILRLNIGGIKHIQAVLPLEVGEADLAIRADHFQYYFSVNNNTLGQGAVKYLTSEVSGGFTGVVIGCYAVDEMCQNTATFTEYCCQY